MNKYLVSWIDNIGLVGTRQRQIISTDMRAALSEGILKIFGSLDVYVEEMCDNFVIGRDIGMVREINGMWVVYLLEE